MGASASSGVEIEPIGDSPPTGAVASALPLTSPSTATARPNRPRVVTNAQDAYATWATEMSGTTGVPTRALQAYAAAAGRVDKEISGCHLDWTTLAGIGYVESANGADGAGLDADGRPLQLIYGPSLDGAGEVAQVSDTDGGTLDAETLGDRAVGPLQFLPSTWLTWGADGDADGTADPQDIDDAALAASRYLCAAGDLGTPVGWTEAVFSYNHSGDYVQAVYDATSQIALASRS